MGEAKTWGVILGWMLIYGVVRGVLTALYKKAMGVTIKGTEWGTFFYGVFTDVSAILGFSLYIWLCGGTPWE